MLSGHYNITCYLDHVCLFITSFILQCNVLSPVDISRGGGRSCVPAGSAGSRLAGEGVG